MRAEGRAGVFFSLLLDGLCLLLSRGGPLTLTGPAPSSLTLSLSDTLLVTVRADGRATAFFFFCFLPTAASSCASSSKLGWKNGMNMTFISTLPVNCRGEGRGAESKEHYDHRA